MTLDVLHVAPFEATRYPPLVNCVNLCNGANLVSLVTTSAPTAHPELVAPTPVEMPPRSVGGVRQLVDLTRRAWRITKTRRPTVVVGHNARGLIAAWLAGAWKTSQLVYHCHDFDLPSGVRGHFLARLERHAANRTTEFWVPAPERVELARALGISRPAIVVRNCPLRLERLPARGRLRHWLTQRGLPSADQSAIIVRHGRIGPAHFVRETIEVLPHLPTNSVLVLIGDGDQEYLEACRRLSDRLGVRNRFLVHPFVPHAQLPALLVDADVAMCVYAPLSINQAAPAPNKVYESMAAGLPVIVTAGGSVAADVTRCGGGYGVDIGAPAEFGRALGRLLRDSALRADCGSRARRAHLTDLNYEVQLAGTLVGQLLRKRSVPSPVGG